ncbi:MAG: hypothetical protein C4K47_00045 [Candidatus Thorarchaeota archaeon]|nr:MAG: hypothetical protein C4K47_00045 [Candidatus Thorarchaeota archaeon]
MRLFIDFNYVFVWALLAVALVVIMLAASWILRPHILQNSDKTSTYECGEEPIGPARVSYPYSYFLYTILFVIVDVMGAFLWLLSVSQFRTTEAAVWQMLFFVLLITAGIGFALRMFPQTILSGKETLKLYREGKARRDSQKTEAAQQ